MIRKRKTEKNVQKTIDQLKKRDGQQKEFRLLKNKLTERISRDKALAQIEKELN